jgi:trigger factor
VKTAVETLNPTRVKLTVEVPFEELKPSLDEAYKKIGAQVQIPGFRKGKVPARLIDQRFGRGAVLEEAVNDALPKFYGQAIRDNEVQALGQPEVDVTEVPDPEQGGDLKFSAEVDVRPEIELPDFAGMEVRVDDAQVTDEDVDEQITQLRERFGSLKGVDRPAADGDFVSLDLAATIDGEPLDDATANGMSYQIGSGSLLEGLDEAITGRSADETATFTTKLLGGEQAGGDAEVTATVRSVKERELPELDDDFAQMASEFDTVDELRTEIRSRLERTKKLEQGVAARDKALDQLLERIDVPLPESVVRAEVEGRLHNLQHQLENAGMTKEAYVASEGQSVEEFDAEVEKTSREAVKAQFVLDAIANREKLQVAEQELTEHLVRHAMRAGVPPEQFAQQLVQAGQVPMLVAEVIRGKALAVILDSVNVLDASGEPVDLTALREDAAEPQVGDVVDVDESGDAGDAGEQAGAVPANDEQAAPLG